MRTSGRATPTAVAGRARAPSEISADCFELAVADDDALLRVDGSAPSRRGRRAVAPADDEQRGRRERDERRGEREPDVAAERALLPQDEHAEDCPRRPRRRGRRARRPSRGSAHERVHARAPAGSHRSRRRTTAASSSNGTPLKRTASVASLTGRPPVAGAQMVRRGMRYAPRLQRWAARPIPSAARGAIACLALGDANRGAHSWPIAAVSDHEEPAATTPPSSGLSRVRAHRSAVTMAPMVRKVLLASPRGYCAGVERAVETVERALELYGPPVYVRKQIVHNLHVVRDLEARGAVFVDEETEVPEGETVVFSAHGVAPSVHANAAARRLNTIDATCPLVTKVHVQARRYAAAGYTVVLIGHEGHEEVVGTMGEAPDVDRARRVRRRRRAPRLRTRTPSSPTSRRRRSRSTRPPRSSPRSARRFPRDLRAEEGRHLLRDLQPAVGGQGDARRDRRCCS